MKQLAFNQDCMEAMAQMPDKAFDLAIVDPPYGEDCDINSKGNRCATRNGFSNLYLNHTSRNWNVRPDREYFSELFRVSKNQIIWGGNFFDLPPTSAIVVWNKMQRDFTFGDGEVAWTSFNKAIRIFDMARGTANAEKRIHISQKPVALYKWLLTNYAKPGDKILDTHLGSGSSRIAAYDLGFEFVGYELDKDYFDAQEKRFAEHIAQPKLFEPVAEKMEQGLLI